MKIESTHDLQQSMNAAAKTLDDLVSERDKLYSELDQLYSSDSYTKSGRTERENTLRSGYAAAKKSALNRLQDIISDIHEWDNTTTARSTAIDTEFAVPVQMAVSMGTTATKEVVEAVLMLGNNRIQVAALCSILADKCTDETAKKAIADKIYSADTYYAETASKLNEYLSADDFQLVSAARLFRDMCYKISNAAAYVTFSSSANSDIHRNDAPYSTSTPITVE